MATMLELFTAARRVSVPIVVMRTTDQTATLAKTAKGMDENVLVRWDAAEGLSGVNKLGAEALKKAGVTPENSQGFVDAMVAIRTKVPQGAVVYALNAHRQLASQEPLAIAAAVQAVANLRDVFKLGYKMLVLLCPSMAVPAELEQDVVVLDDELPTPEQLRGLVKDLYDSAKQEMPADGTVDKAVDALSGLSDFAAEQVTAMSFRPAPYGLDVKAMWERKKVAIEQTPGLSVYDGAERFADIIGVDALKEQLGLRLRGKRPIGVVVWIDEIDKALANVEQDTSGVRMYQLLKLLTEMEDNEWPGFVGVGVPGAGKSLVAKALGNEAGVPTIALDLGATESKYVGESEANMLRIMQVIKAVGRGHAYFVATSNAATVMRPELQRRFFDGMWMFDLMTKAERDAAWKFYVRKYALAVQPLPDDEAWTGAEIRNACRRAYDTGCSLIDAAKTVVPMARSRANEIEDLRKFAHGRFLDATRGDHYRYEQEPMRKQVRAINLTDVALATALAPMGES
jgi:hypothetical protein